MIAIHDVDILIAIGNNLARIMADQAEKTNPKMQVYTFNSNRDTYRLLKKIVDENSIVLFKGNMYANDIIELAAKFRKEQ
ncbi:hypothetical protein V7122_05170 [Bacillus sp. JJ1532]